MKFFSFVFFSAENPHDLQIECVPVSEKDHTNLQRKYKNLKRANANNYLEEAMKEYYRIEKQILSFELTNAEGSLEKKKKENIILKEENKELKPDRQGTKEEMQQRESDQRIFKDENKVLKQELQRTNKIWSTA